MLRLGTGHKFTLLWHHPSQLSNHSSILPSSQGAQAQQGREVAELLRPSSRRRGPVDLLGVAVKVIMMVVTSGSWSRATLVLSPQQLSLPSRVWSLPCLLRQQGAPSHPSLPLLEPPRDHSLWSQVLHSSVP